MIGGETSGGNYAVDMRMKLQALVPAMEHAEEADLGTEMPWIAGDLEQSFRAGVEEQVVNEPLVLQCEQGLFPRQSEYGMDIASGQQFALARLEPAPARVALASRAMPVSTRVVGDPGRMSAAGAAVAVPAQRDSAAARNSQAAPSGVAS